MNSDSLWAQSAQQFQQMLTQGWSQALESFQKMDLGANKAPMPMRMAPEKLQALQTQYLQEATELWQKSLQGQVAAQDRRFADVSWAQNPLAAFSAAAYLLNARTMTQLAEAIDADEKTRARIRFGVEQWIAAMSPSNYLAFNPEAQKKALETQGESLAKGIANLLHDIRQGHVSMTDESLFEVGRNVATTEGAVVFENDLFQLIEYKPLTAKVYERPFLLVPPCINKYYILDLSPENSMVRYLVSQGHSVYMLSWRNPDASDHDLTMDDYLKLGVLDTLQAIGHLQDKAHPVHAMGYCLGGTLLAIAAAALAKAGRRGVMGYSDLPHLKTLSMLAAQTDFSEPGELGLFIDESQIGFLDNITLGQGYLSGKQMAGSFQFLHSRDLVWTRRMREYLMGEREQPNDLMAWNADTTRMPARMHHEYLTSLYLNNALATSSYRVDGRAVSLADLRLPIFMVGTERDHISPWRSVYKLRHLCDAEMTFVLTSGGHNAGIISEPGHARRSYRMAARPAHGPWIEPEEWTAQATAHEGSWWPAWHQWLASKSSRKQAARPVGAHAVLCDAPGEYVLQRYAD